LFSFFFLKGKLILSKQKVLKNVNIESNSTETEKEVKKPVQNLYNRHLKLLKMLPIDRQEDSAGMFIGIFVKSLAIISHLFPDTGIETKKPESKQIGVVTPLSNSTKSHPE
jgi:hypothetical protein